MIEFIKLQSAHITQITDSGERGEWSVQENITNNELFKLPAHLSDDEVFTIMESARKFELEAFNIGIQFGKDINKCNMQMATDENIRLAATLDELTRRM